MKKSIILTTIVICVAVLYFTAPIWITPPSFKNEKFVIIEKGDYSYFIRHIPAGDTIIFYDSINSMRHTMILTRKEDTLFTVLDQQSYLYNHYKAQDQFFNSYKAGDTIIIKSIKKSKFWTKL